MSRLIVTRLSPSIYNFQLGVVVSSSESDLDLTNLGFHSSSTTNKYESYYASVKLKLKPTRLIRTGDEFDLEFDLLVRLVIPADKIKPTSSSEGDKLSITTLACDLRVRQLLFRKSEESLGFEVNEIMEPSPKNDYMIGYHIEDLIQGRSDEECCLSQFQGQSQLTSLKSSPIKQMKIIVIFSEIRSIPASDSPKRRLLPQKILDICTTYNLHLRADTIIDLRSCPLSSTSSIKFLFVQDCTIKNSTPETESGLIGRVTSKTKIIIEKVHITDYYLRQANSQRAKSLRNIELDSLNKPFVILSDLIKLQIQLSYNNNDRTNSYRRCKVWQGILLAGPPGCGKNLLIHELSQKMAANLVQFNFEAELMPSLTTSAAAVDYSSVCKKLETTFDDAIQSSLCYPTILHLEHVHLLDSSSSGGENITRSKNNKMKLLIHLCRLFDRISGISSIHASSVLLTVIGTTDQPHLVPAQLRMYGRFEQEMFMNLPSELERQHILKSLVNGMREFNEIDLVLIARSTPGYTRADLTKLVHLARIKSIAAASRERVKTSVVLNMKDVEDCIKNIHPSSMKSFLINSPSVKWDDIGGQSDLKFKLKQAIEWPLKHSEAFKRLGITPPRGVLMYGPPGCSKTMIAKAIASECGLNFFSVNGSGLFSQWVGDSEKAVQSLFREARQVSPCIVFFDEIDSIVGERGSSSNGRGGGSSVHERVISQLLIEIDGVESLKNVTVIAATNRPDMVDPALLRPGRLDRIIYVPLPDKETRKEIFKIHFKKIPVSAEIDIDKLVKLTDGYSGAELTAICQEAALHSLEENLDSTVVYESHFLQAVSSVSPRTTQTQIEFYEKYRQAHQSTA